MKFIQKNPGEISIVFCIIDLRAGGAERVISSLANKLCSMGYVVSFVCYSSEHFIQHYSLNEKIKIHFIETGSIKKLRWTKRILSMCNILKRINPNIVISFLSPMNVYSSWSCKILGIPNIVCERNCPWMEPKEKIERFYRNAAFYISNWCVFQTYEIQNYFSQKIRKKSSIIPNPIFLECVQDIPVENRVKKVVAVGRYIEQKNYLLLLEAFKEFNKTHSEYILEVYGKDCGQRRELLNWIVCNNMDRIIFLNPESNCIHEKIKNAEIFIMTSTYEGMPNALAEAAALGITCIAVDCQGGGVRDILSSGKRGIIIGNDKNELIKALIEVENNIDKRRQFQKQGQELYKYRNVEQVVDVWEKLIIELIR